MDVLFRSSGNHLGGIGRERPGTSLTNLNGRRGVLGMGLATDGRYVCFAWRDDVGDIWVADLERDD